MERGKIGNNFTSSSLTRFLKLKHAGNKTKSTYSSAIYSTSIVLFLGIIYSAGVLLVEIGLMHLNCRKKKVNYLLFLT